MQIIHPLNEFIYSIFPQVDEGDTAGLKQALTANPDDYITMTNISAKLMQAGQQKEAQRYFEAALSVDDTCPNTH